jgi:hypothetical protein
MFSERHARSYHSERGRAGIVSDFLEGRTNSPSFKIMSLEEWSALANRRWPRTLKRVRREAAARPL